MGCFRPGVTLSTRRDAELGLIPSQGDGPGGKAHLTDESVTVQVSVPVRLGVQEAQAGIAWEEDTGAKTADTLELPPQLSHCQRDGGGELVSIEPEGLEAR